jgi:hypothetical protein
VKLKGETQQSSVGTCRMHMIHVEWLYSAIVYLGDIFMRRMRGLSPVNLG